jgi:hypothetical protein
MGEGEERPEDVMPYLVVPEFIPQDMDTLAQSQPLVNKYFGILKK